MYVDEAEGLAEPEYIGDTVKLGTVVVAFVSIVLVVFTSSIRR